LVGPTSALVLPINSGEINHSEGDEEKKTGSQGGKERGGWGKNLRN
jgi:hypothetical protein